MVPQLGRLKVMKGWMICACSNPWLPKGRSKKAQIASLHHGFAVGFDNFLSFRAGAICMLGAVRIKILHPHEAFWWAAPPWTWWQDFRQSGTFPLASGRNNYRVTKAGLLLSADAALLALPACHKAARGYLLKSSRNLKVGTSKFGHFKMILFIGHCLFSGFHDL